MKTVGKRSAARTSPARKPVKRPATEDHRVRVARERRERMRAALLQSVLDVGSTLSPNGVVSIDDVIRHANVARGTFYNYFTSMDEALAELGLQMADEMTASILPVYDVLESPIMRTASGFQLFLVRGMLQPRWAGFVARLGLLRGDNLFISKVHSDIKLGTRTGDYAVASVEMAGDLLMGAKTEALLRIIKTGGSLDYVCGTAALVLRAFGVLPDQATLVAKSALSRLLDAAPGTVSWWPRGTELTRL
jgi:AcrR family transcriptional regulator